MIADQLIKIKDQILDHWRREVRSSPEQAALVAHLDDRDLQDHLPALTERIIAILRGEPAEGLIADAVEHGRQRYSGWLFGGPAAARNADISAGSRHYGL
jgi:hypothetical protein